MNIRWWVAPSIALVAIAAAHCGGDDSSATNPTGSAGSSGSSATGGRGGSGTSTMTGSPGSGGSATGGSGGTGGSTGTAGSAGSGGSGTGVSSGGSGGTGGSAGAGTDAAAGSGGTSSDAGKPDSPSDAPNPLDVVIPGDANACPANEPTEGDACTGNEVCRYGNGGCACVNAGDGGREWRCQRAPDAGTNPDCPATPPTNGSPCPDGGVTGVCRYPGNNFCACNARELWRCI